MGEAQGTPPGAAGEQVTPPPAESAQRITPADVERAKAEKEAAFTALMDRMEASVETQGQYFVRVGQKVPLTEVQSETRSRFMGLKKESFDRDVEVGFDDQRVLILNTDEMGEKGYLGEGGRRRNTREFTMITPDGIKTLSLQEETDGKYGQVAETIDKLRNGRQPAPGSGFVRLEGDTSYIKIGWLPDPKQYDVHKAPGEEGKISVGRYGEARQFAGSAEDFQARIQRSIDETESPHRKVVEETSTQRQLANSAAEMISNLPPRA